MDQSSGRKGEEAEDVAFYLCVKVKMTDRMEGTNTGVIITIDDRARPWGPGKEGLVRLGHEQTRKSIQMSSDARLGCQQERGS